MITASQWLDFLHRGGNVAHFWNPDPQPTSSWFENNQRARAIAFREAARIGGDIYVSINPSTRIPPQNKSGSTDPKRISKQIEDIQCINVLHCEYDGKDWVTEDDARLYLPDDYQNSCFHW